MTEQRSGSISIHRFPPIHATNRGVSVWTHNISSLDQRKVPPQDGFQLWKCMLVPLTTRFSAFRSLIVHIPDQLSRFSGFSQMSLKRNVSAYYSVNVYIVRQIWHIMVKFGKWTKMEMPLARSHGFIFKAVISFNPPVQFNLHSCRILVIAACRGGHSCNLNGLQAPLMTGTNHVSDTNSFSDLRWEEKSVSWSHLSYAPRKYLIRGAWLPPPHVQPWAATVNKLKVAP